VDQNRRRRRDDLSRIPNATDSVLLGAATVPFVAAQVAPGVLLITLLVQRPAAVWHS